MVFRLPWSSRLTALEKAVALTAVVSLLASVTNLVPLSAALAVPALLAPLLMLGRRRVPSVAFSLALLLCYFLLWTLLYHPSSLLEYSFLRRDGNVFITFAPLLLLSLLRLDLDVERIVRVFLFTATALNGLFLVIYAVTGGTIFFYEPGIYHFLFYAHNAAGGFLAVLTVLCLGYFVALRDPAFLVLTTVNLIGLVATYSRGSILALIVAGGIVLVLRGRLVRSMVAAIVIGHLVVLPWLYQVAPPAAIHVEQEALVDSRMFDALPRAHTIALRALYLWPRAWHLFLASPVVGTGFGSYNDLPYDLRELAPMLAVNRPVEVRHNDAHAHHTFLHVLAETGLVGLLLLCFFLQRVYQFVVRLRDPALRDGLHMVFWVAVISSLTEHRLFTPSQMLPFTILLGLLVAQQACQRRRSRSAFRPWGSPGAPAVAGSIRSGGGG